MGFGLERQYSIIGQELLDLETRGCIGEWLGNDRFDMAVLSFREAVVFVSVEVLEAYLEDLLNVKVSEKHLCIKRAPLWRGLYSVAAVVLFFCSIVIAYSWWDATPTSRPFLLAGGITLVTLVLWLYYPRVTLARRIAFARLVSYEVCRRRGRKPEATIGRSDFLESLIGKKAGFYQGVAAITVRRVAVDK